MEFFTPVSELSIDMALGTDPLATRWRLSVAPMMDWTDRHCRYFHRLLTRHITVQQRAGGHHLGIKPGVARQQAVEITAMAVGPIHHGGDGQAPAAVV